ncbi:MAG: TIGR02266 family protein [Candidatus Methylomirabilales bacterium]
MSTEERPRIRRHLRFTRYLSVHCTVLSPEQSQPRSLEGTTRNVNAGGLEMLLPEALPPKTLVSVRIADADPLRGHVVSVGESVPTVLGERFPHGVAFEQPVDASLVRRWVSHPKRRVHTRARVTFDVEYKQAGTPARGTCLNLCKGGMFIATERPFAPGTEVNLSFKLPGRSDSILVRAHITWISGVEKDSNAITGMGVKFLDLDPSAASLIGTLVDRLCEEAPAPDPSQSPTPSR